MLKFYKKDDVFRFDRLSVEMGLAKWRGTGWGKQKGNDGSVFTRVRKGFAPAHVLYTDSVPNAYTCNPCRVKSSKKSNSLKARENKSDKNFEKKSNRRMER